MKPAVERRMSVLLRNVGSEGWKGREGGETEHPRATRAWESALPGHLLSLLLPQSESRARRTLTFFFRHSRQACEGGKTRRV